MSASTSSTDAVRLVDAHVHLHPGVDLATALDAASTNFDAAARDLGRKGAVHGVLMLTESRGVDAFAALPETAGAWRLEPTDEPQSRLARRDGGGGAIAIVAGRQIVAREGIEISALGIAQTPPDGAPARESLAAAHAAGALVALPWGVGKWSGGRGALIAALIDDVEGFPDLFLADSGVRPAAMARPALLSRGEAAGRRVLAGTDPLPVRGAEAKIGRFGFVAEGAGDPARPFAALAAQLRAATASPQVYGRLESLPAFAAQQAWMQIRKRLR